MDKSFPRTRGGDPPVRRPSEHLRLVFPAHAGVIPAFRPDAQSTESFPRTRGGDPIFDYCFCFSRRFSPHTRG